MVSRFALEARLRERERALVSKFREQTSAIEPLGFLERIELASVHARRIPTRGGLTAKQAELLAGLLGRRDGLVAKELEAWLARRSPNTGIVGWAASDCTVSLHRLEARGLVRCEQIHEGNIRLRWFLTPEGEALHLKRSES